MSRTYSIICKNCREELWIGQSTIAGDIRVYHDEADKQGRFYLKHLGHDLTVLEDQKISEDMMEFEPDPDGDQ